MLSDQPLDEIVPTGLLKRVLALDGYTVVTEDTEYWVLAKSDVDLQAVARPIVLLKTELFVPADVLTHLLSQARITTRRYVELCEIAKATAAFATMRPTVH